MRQVGGSNQIERSQGIETGTWYRNCFLEVKVFTLAFFQLNECINFYENKLNRKQGNTNPRPEINLYSLNRLTVLCQIA